MTTRTELTKAIRQRYQKATRQEKGVILDELCKTTGWHRKHAIRKLSDPVPPPVKRGSKRLVGKKETRGRKPVYTDEVLSTLRKVWAVLDCPCGKRLVAVMEETLDACMRFGEIDITKDTYERLCVISAATCDRLLAHDRRKLGIKGRSTTKPGSLLKSQIPIRTFADWNEQCPGFVEIDLVAHCGQATSGEYVNTLDVTDIATGWTETRACINKAKVHVLKEMKHIKENLPFDLLGIDSDNGSEFINHHFYEYCLDQSITFTRSRANHKNDGCYVEGKNWHVVRKLIGYERYEGQRAVDVLNEIYGRLRLFTNFFSPQQKLLTKTRNGARVRKVYDKAKTPYKRVLEDENVPDSVKKKLKEQYLTLNPVTIRKEILELISQLRSLSIRY